MLGRRIKNLRKERKATLKDVAEATGLSQGYLSQIETDKVEPSISVLRKLASYYKVLMLYFFDAEPVDNMIVKREERQTIGKPGDPLMYELLTHNGGNKKMEGAIMKIAPNYRDPEGVYASYPGEECFMILKGSLQFEQDGAVHTLNEGDTIYYECSKPFRLFNPTSHTTELVGFCTPPHRQIEDE